MVFSVTTHTNQQDSHDITYGDHAVFSNMAVDYVIDVRGVRHIM